MSRLRPNPASSDRDPSLVPPRGPEQATTAAAPERATAIPVVETASRRPRGTGGLRCRDGAWLGKFDGREVTLNPKFGGVREVLTETQASRLLAQRMGIPWAGSTDGLLVADAAEAFLQSTSDAPPGTREGYRCAIECHIRPTLGDRPLINLLPADIVGFISTLAAKGLSRKSIGTYVSVLRRMLAHAQNLGWIDENPSAEVKVKRRDEPPVVRSLSEDDARALLDLDAEDLHELVWLLIIRIALLAGLRLSEILALRWRDIDYPLHVLRVVHSLRDGELGPTKTYCQRAVPLHSSAEVLLRRLQAATRWPTRDDFVFRLPGEAGPPSRHRVRRHFRASCERVGVCPARFHDLRHTFAVTAARHRVPIPTLQKFLGHSSLRTTEMYLIFTPNEHDVATLREALGVLSEWRDAPPASIRQNRPEARVPAVETAGDGGRDIGLASLAEVLNALKDPYRRRIVHDLLAYSPSGRGRQSYGLDMPKATRSRHYRVLRDAGLVSEIRTSASRVTPTVNAVSMAVALPGLIETLLAGGPPSLDKYSERAASVAAVRSARGGARPHRDALPASRCGT